MENELNKWIAEVLFEGCWHDWRSMGPNWGYRCGKDCGKTLDALLDSVSDDELLTALTGNASPCDFSVIEHHRDHLDWKGLGNLLSVPSGAESTSPANYNPDYCNDLNLASLAEAKAIEVVGKKAYFEHLCYVTQDATWRPEYEKREVTFCLSLATATALQRCTAVRAAVEGK